MRKLFIYLTVCFISVQVFGQSDTIQRQLFERKIVSYEKMMRTGYTLIAVGGTSMIGGTVMLMQGKNNRNSGTVSDEINIGLGLVAIGLPMLVTGLVLNSVGKRKVMEYYRKVTPAFTYNQGMVAFTLNYRF